MLPMADQIAREQLGRAAAQRVDTGLSAVFTPPVRLLAMSRGWLEGRTPDLSSPQVFNNTFRPILQELEQLTSVVAGTSMGSGLAAAAATGRSLAQPHDRHPALGFAPASAD